MSNNKTYHIGTTKAIARKKERRDILFAAPLVTRKRYQAKLTDTLALFDNSHYSTDIITNRGRTILGQLLFWQKLIRRCPKYKVVHLFYLPGMSLLGHLLPAVIIGRFFGCKVILDNRNINRFDIWHNIGFVFKRMLKMFTAVLVLSDFQKLTLADLNVKSGSIPHAVEVKPDLIKIVKNLQPKILVKVENKKLHSLKYVIGAFELVKQKYPRCELVVAADNPETFQQQVNGVTYVTPEVAEADNEIDLLVNCTRFDYLNNSILEAMKKGLPVISTPVTMIDKFRNGENIIFYRYHDHSGLADRIIELIENPDLTEKLSLQGPLTAGHFTSESIAARWQKFYSGILS